MTSAAAVDYDPVGQMTSAAAASGDYDRHVGEASPMGDMPDAPGSPYVDGSASPVGKTPSVNVNRLSVSLITVVKMASIVNKAAVVKTAPIKDNRVLLVEAPWVAPWVAPWEMSAAPVDNHGLITGF